MPKTSAKYGLKFWFLCYNETSYVWYIQPFHGTSRNRSREKDEGLRVVIDMSYCLKGYNITSDNLFFSYTLGQGHLISYTLGVYGWICCGNF